MTKGFYQNPDGFSRYWDGENWFDSEQDSISKPKNFFSKNRRWFAIFLAVCIASGGGIGGYAFYVKQKSETIASCKIRDKISISGRTLQGTKDLQESLVSGGLRDLQSGNFYKTAVAYLTIQSTSKEIQNELDPFLQVMASAMLCKGHPDYLSTISDILIYGRLLTDELYTLQHGDAFEFLNAETNLNSRLQHFNSSLDSFRTKFEKY